jgi:hypothetical protein
MAPYRGAVLDRTQRIRDHAERLQTLVDNPPMEPGVTYAYRALVEDSEGGVSALALFVPWKGAPVGQAQVSHDYGLGASTNVTTGRYITTTELAVFFNLSSYAAGDVVWVRQELT